MDSRSPTATKWKRAVFALLGLTGLGMLLGWVAFIATEDPPANRAETVAAAPAAKPDSPRAPASLPAKPDTPKKSAPATRLNREQFHFAYFHRELSKIPVVSEYYELLRATLPPGDASELIAIYVSEGPVRRGDSEFAEFMSLLQKDLRAHSGEIATMLEQQDGVLKQDPFVYQMALNLAYQLSIPPDAKARLLGSAMSIPFTKDAQGGVTLMSANITNAFILMKNAGVTLEQAAPYIRKGLATNFNDPDAANEFIARANAYYPGAF